MKFYLAAPFAKRLEMHQYRNELQGLGHIVTSTWLDQTDDTKTDAELGVIAIDDIFDIEKADAIICFTQTPGPYYTGARHVEFGMALAYGMRCIVIGYRENAFYNHPQVEFYETWQEFMLITF